MSYWEDRQRQLNKQLEQDEARLNERLSSFYDTEYAKLEKEIASYYQKYGEDNVIQYRVLMEQLSDGDRRLLVEQMERFAEKYPQYAYLMPVRESIYRLNRLEGLQYSIRMQQLEIGAVNNEEIKGHLERNAMRGVNAAAEALGFGKNFYANNPGITKLFVGVAWSKGKNFSQRIWGNADKLASYLNTDIAQGIARGDSYDRLVQQIQQRFSHVTRSDAYRLIYTEGTYVMAESTMHPFEEDFEEYRISTVGDGGVCPICRGVAEKVFRIKDREPGTNFPPLHPRCRCTFTIEVDDWDKWMEEYERRHGNGQAKKIAKRLGHGIMEPEDKGDLYTDLKNSSDDQEERSLQVNNFLNLLHLPESKWSGKTIIKTDEEMRPLGRKVKNCDIWLKNGAGIKTIIHEHLHARSVSRVLSLKPQCLGYEEGAVELLAEEICKKNGISYKASYKRYVEPLREIHKSIYKDKGAYEFAVDLFNVDPGNRKQWLEREVDTWAGADILRLKSKRKLYDLISGLEE